MAEGNYKDYLQKDTVRVKKYFYVLRPILACQWIEQTNTVAPMEFRTLLDALVTDAQLKAQVEELLHQKMSGMELGEQPRIQIINDFLEERIQYYTEFLQQNNFTMLPETSKLNMLFRESLHEVYGAK